MKTAISWKLGPAALAIALAAGCGGKSDADAMAAAKSAMVKHDHSTAVVELKAVLQKTPNLGEARYLLGVALMEQGDYASALLELKKSQELNFDDEVLAPKLARVWLATGKFKEVVQTYAQVSAKVAVNHAELATAVAVAHARLGQKDAALAAVTSALKADARFPWALLTKARIVAASGQTDEALALTEQAMVPGSPNGEAYMLRGMLLSLAKKDANGAIAAYGLAAADLREAVGARTALIQLLLSQGKLPDAKAQLVALQKSHPKSPQTAYLDAVVAYASKDYARADAIVEQLLRLSPGSPQLLVLGGAASIQRGSLVSAETKLGKVVQTVDRVPVARKLLAETYLRLGQPEKALAALRPLLEQFKPDADALALAGQAHLQAGHAQEAEVMFAAAVRIKPDDVQARTALALTDLVKGNAGAAFDALENIAAKDPGETADLALISVYLRRRDYDQALAAISRLEKKQPGKPAALHLRGVALRGKGDLVGARSAFEAALNGQPDHFASVASLVALDVHVGKSAEARTRLEATIKSYPKNISARLALVDLMVREKSKPEVILAAIDEAIKVAPTDSAPYIAKIIQLSRLNDVKGAVSAAQTAMAALPNQPDVLDAAGQALVTAGDHQQAISAFSKLAGLLPRSPLPHLRLTDLHAQRGDTPAAMSSLNRAFEAAPESAEVHRRFLAQAVKTKDFRAVLSAAKDLQKRYAASATGFLLEGDAETANKAWPKAIAAYRLALKKADPSGRAQRSLYATLQRSGDETGADRFAADWLKSNTSDVLFREHLGGEAILRKDFVVAERHFRDVLRIRPKSGSALNNLAWLLAERGGKGAVQMVERALELAPNAPPLLDTLAKALAGEGQLDRAIDAQRRAVEAAPERYEYRLNLAALYVKAGKRIEASTELAALSKLGKAFPFHTEVEELVRKVGK